MLDIKALIAKLLYSTSGWTSVSGATGTVRYRIIRNSVWIDISGQSPTTSWTQIATIPSDIRPHHTIRAQGYCGGNGMYPMTIYLDSSGLLQISASSSRTSGGGTLIYPLL